MLFQKYIAIRRKKKKDSEKLYADIAHMVRTKDHSETNLTSDTESDTDQENEVLSFLYHFIKHKAYSIEMIENFNLGKEENGSS